MEEELYSITVVSNVVYVTASILSDLWNYTMDSRPTDCGVLLEFSIYCDLFLFLDGVDLEGNETAL